MLSVVLFLAGCAAPGGGESAEAREPKRLEARVLLELDEFLFRDGDGNEGGPFHVNTGEVVGIHVVNRGDAEHEALFGRGTGGEEEGYQESLFEDLEVAVFVYAPEKVEIETEGFEEAELEPGGEFWIRVTFPEEARGEWEIGCFIPGHYEQGMHAAFIVQ